MLSVAIGHSEDIDTVDAIEDVIKQCNEKMKGCKPQAGLLFSSIDYDNEFILNRINQEYPDIELIGSTAEAQISSELGLTEDSICLILFCSDEINISAGVGKQVSLDHVKAAKEAVAMAKGKLDAPPELSIITIEGLTKSQVLILDSLKVELGELFPIVGGSASGCYDSKTTYQFYKTEVLQDSIPVLLFAGPILYSCGVSSGWRPIGKPDIVTRVENNVVYEVENMTMLDYYKHYLGDHDITYGEHPIAVFEKDDKHYYLRVPFYFDTENKSVTFAGDIPQGAKVQLSEVSTDGIVEAAEESASSALENYPGKEPLIALAFSCCVRRNLLGTRTCKECEVISAKFQPDFPFAGFYTYGEIAPLDTNSPSRQHNATFVTLLLGVK